MTLTRKTGRNIQFAAQRVGQVIGMLVGTLAFSYSANAQVSVSNWGSPSYSVAIPVPPGIAGMTPSLGLAYSGFGVNGPVGHGWSMQGLSVISRCPNVRAIDGQVRGVQYDKQDKLCLDGQRLIQTDAQGGLFPTQIDDSAGGAAGSAVREFRTEKDTYARIRAYGSAGNDVTGANGPAYFKVWTKSGQVYEYGNNTNASANANIVALGKTVVSAWAVSRISDTVGNYIDFQYAQRDVHWGSRFYNTASQTAESQDSLGHEWYLEEVRYTGNSGKEAQNRVRFVYEDRPETSNGRQDRSETFHLGSKNVSVKRLTSVNTYINWPASTPADPSTGNPPASAVQVNAVNITYEQGAVTGRSRVATVKVCAGPVGDKCLPSTKFIYGEGGGETYAPNATFSTSPLSSSVLINKDGVHNASTSGVVPFDFDGDGKTDFLLWSHPNDADPVVGIHDAATNWLYRSNGDGSFTQIANFSISERLFDADGCFATQIADFDGDGLPDLLRIANPEKSNPIVDGAAEACPTPRINYLYLSNGDGSFRKIDMSTTQVGLEKTESVVTVFGCNSLGCYYARRPGGAYYYVTDVDGDGRADFVTTTMPGGYAGFFQSESQVIWPDQCQTTKCTRIYKYNDSTNQFEEIGATTYYPSLYRSIVKERLNRKSQFDTSTPALADLNGDGILDITTDADSWIVGATTDSGGNVIPSFTKLVGTPTEKSCLQQFDYNGDGRSDCFYPSAGASYTGTTKNYVYTGTGMGANRLADAPANGVVGFNLSGEVLTGGATVGNILVDFNGDGKSDILRLSSNAGDTVLFLSNGNGTFTKSTSFNLSGSAADSNRQLRKFEPDRTYSRDFVMGDFLGNGTIQLLRMVVGPTSGEDQTNQLYVKADPTPPDQLMQVVSGNGLKSDLTWVPLTQSGGRYAHDRGTANKATYPDVDVIMPMQVVTAVTTDSGVGSARTSTQYGYAGLKATTNGRGLLGFREIRRQKPGADGSDISVVTQYLLHHPYNGVASSTETSLGSLYGSGPRISRSEFTYCVVTGDSAVDALAASQARNTGLHCAAGTAKLHRPHLLKSVESGWDLVGQSLPTVTTTNTYNASGDPTVIQVDTEAIVLGVSRKSHKTTTNTYVPDSTSGDNWILGRLSRATQQSTLDDVSLGVAGAGIVPSPGNANMATATQGINPGVLLTAPVFGSTGVGSSSTAAAVLTNGSTASVTISPPGSNAVAGADFSFVSTTCTGTLAVGASCTVTIRFSPTVSTARTGSLTVDTALGAKSTTWTATAAAITTTTTALASNLNPAPANAPVTLTATITPSTATGTVTFSDGAASLGTVSVTSGVATQTASFAILGAHSLKATFAGSGTYGNSSSVALSQSVLTPTVTTLTSSANPVNVSTSVTFTATVTRTMGTGVVSGSVQFKDGATNLRTVALDTTGKATLSKSWTATGSHPITATYVQNATFATSSASLTQIVGVPTSTTLTTSVNPSAPGASVTMTATVARVSGTGTPTGTVTFKNGTTSLGTGTLNTSTGVATLTKTFAYGVHNLTAVYGGSTTYAGSTSASYVQNAGTPTTMTITPSALTVATGENVTFTANISPPGATGSVTFKTGATTLGTATFSGGAAVFTTSFATTGVRNITASYAGVNPHLPSVSGSTSVVTVKLPVTIGLTSDTNPVDRNQPTVLKAKVAPAIASPIAPTGTVTFKDGTTTLGTAIVDAGGYATLSVSFAIDGAHSLTAIYGGDATYAPKTTVASTQSVRTPTTLQLSSSQNPAPQGQSVSLTAQVNNPAATGTVTFKEGSALLRTVAIGTGGIAALSNFTFAATGTHTVTASYSGDSTFGTSQATVDQAIGTALVELGTTPASVGLNSAVSLTAKVTPLSATGTVTFKDGAASLGTVTLDGLGNAALNASFASLGAHSITATYNGNPSFPLSTSSAQIVTVKTGTTTALVTSAPAGVSSGTNVTLTATVNNTGATGTVTFLDGTAELGTAIVAGGNAALTASFASNGKHNLTASYSGDGSFLPSVSPVTVQPVGTPIGTFTVIAGSNTSTTSTVTIQNTGSGTIAGIGASCAISGGAITSVVPSTLAPNATMTVTSTHGNGPPMCMYTFTGTNVSNTSYQVPELALNGLTLNCGSPAAASANAPASATLQCTLSNSGMLPVNSFGYSANPTGPTITGPMGACAAGSLCGNVTVSSPSTYSGNITATANTGATSTAAVALTVNPYATTTALSSNLNPAQAKQNITYTATVSPATATGTVTFLENGVSMGTGTIVGGQATLTTFFAIAGTHNITASYGGNGSYGASTSTNLSQVVTQIPTTTSMSASPNPGTQNQNVTLTATVLPAAATGTVTFTEGATSLGSASIVGGSATLTTSFATTGTHNLKASYGGDISYAASDNAAALTPVVISPALNGTFTVIDGSITSGTASTVTIQNTGSGTITGISASCAIGGGTIPSAVPTSLAPNATMVVNATRTQGLPMCVFTFTGTNVNNSGYQVQETNLRLLSLSCGTPTGTTTPTASTMTCTLSNTGLLGASTMGYSTTIPGASVSGPTGACGAGATCGTVTVTSSTAVGSYSGTATATANTGAATTTTSVTMTVSKLSSATALASSLNPAQAKQNITFTATVTPAAATGTVTFLDNGVSIGTGTLNVSGVAALTTSLASAGTHTITATYGGDTNYGSSGATLAAGQVITAIPTTTSLSASPNPGYQNQNVTLTATVLPAGATGVVTFTDGATALGAASIVGNTATLTTTFTTTGTHNLKASYGGDASYAASDNAAALTSLVINPQALGTFALIAGSNTTTTSTVTIQNTGSGTITGIGVTCGISGGTITSVVPGSLAPNATLTVTANHGYGPPMCLYTFTGTNVTNSGYQVAETSMNVLSLSCGTPTSTTAPTAATVSCSLSNSGMLSVSTIGYGTTIPGASVGGPTGACAAGATCGTVTVTSSTAAGSYSGIVTATGNTGATSTAGPMTLTVNNLSTTTSLSSNLNPAPAKQNITFTANVSPSAATGTVTFLDNGVSMGTGTLTAGQATLTTFFAIAGTHNITASYGGGGSYGASNSTTLNQNVTLIPTTTSLSASPNPGYQNQNVTLTATVLPAAASGTVTFTDGATPLGTASIVSGLATLTTSFSTTGSHSLTASYGGDVSYASSSSTAVLEDVQPTAVQGTFSVVGVVPNPMLTYKQIIVQNVGQGTITGITGGCTSGINTLTYFTKTSLVPGETLLANTSGLATCNLGLAGVNASNSPYTNYSY